VTDVLIKLQRASWRNLEFPVTQSSYAFTQEQAQHRYIFRDDKLIESVGRENPTYTYTIPFREDIVKGPYKNLFRTVYPKFLAACQDRSRGTLIDPVHGSVPAKCVSLREIRDPNRRDGVDVEVEFIRAPAENQLGVPPEIVISIEGAKVQGRRFDEAIKKIDWKQYEPPEPTMNPLDIVAAVGTQVELTTSRITAALADTAERLERAVETIDKLRNPDLAPMRLQARRTQVAVLELEQRTDPTGLHPVSRVRTAVDRSISVVARELGMTVAQLVQLNPALARSPLVPAGTVLKTFATDNAA
jgi:hypothetical protein